MQGTRAHACQLAARLLPTQQPRSMSVGSSVVQLALASVAHAERRAALVAAGEAPRARRGRRGGHSQQVQLARIDRVENFVQIFYGATSRSRSRSRGRRPLPSAPLVRGARPKAGPFNVFAPRVAPAVPRGVQTPLIPPSSAAAPSTRPPAATATAASSSAAKNDSVAGARLTGLTIAAC